MSDLTDLQALKTATIARLTEITAEPKPSYIIDGQNIQWSAYRDALWNQLREIKAEIKSLSAPVEVLTRGFTGPWP